MNLYEISKHYKDLFDNLEADENGEISDESFALIAKTSDELTVKVDNTARYIQNLEAMNASIDSEIERLKKLKSSNDNKIDQVKKFALYILNSCGFDKLQGSTFVISTRKSTSTEVIDEEKLPEKYRTVVQTTKIDKKKIADDIDSGVEVPGAVRKTNKNIIIK